ncbi:MAG: hypothetical protein HY235_06860 [Acidobacteria bacterium]|nr:hypothetical protein [Acidobacteriota bacterium]
MWMDDLKDTGAGVQARAAYHLFVENPDSVSGDAAAAESLDRLIQSGESSPAVLLLASFAPTPRTLGLLRTLKAERGEEPAKLHPWSHPVGLCWAADLSLARLGDPQARSALLESIATATLAQRLLVLDAISAIDDPTVLHQVATYLADNSEISTGVPHGAEPRRRLQDYAVDQLAARLRLPLSFPLNSHGRYGSAEIEETRRLVRQSIPS